MKFGFRLPAFINNKFLITIIFRLAIKKKPLFEINFIIKITRKTNNYLIKYQVTQTLTTFVI